MKLTHIAFAVASLSVASVHAATSLPGLSAAPNNIPADRQVFIAGASALTNSLQTVVTSMCSGTVTPASCGSAGVAMLCSSGNASSGFPGLNFAVIKRDTDGSFAGVGNVITQTQIPGWCDRVGTTPTISTLTIAPNAGLTDVDTNVWKGMSPSGTNTLTIDVPTPVGITTFGGFAGQAFGLMVSDNMYKAMQSVQADDGRLPLSCDSDTNNSNDGVFEVNNLTPGQCQPSISKEEYAAVVDSGNFAYANNGALTGIVGAPVNLCRRVQTSGTQAASNVYFLNNSCGNANPTFGFKAPKKVVLVSDGGSGVVVASGGVSGNYEEFPGVFSIFEGSGTGDTRNCISRRDLGQDPNGTVDVDGLGKFAIGVVSLENPLAAGRQYIKLDGVSPNAYQVVVGSAADIAGGGAADGWAQDTTNRITTVRGLYDFAPELEMLVHNASNSPAKVTALTKIKNTFADPNAINLNGVFQANGAFTHAANPTKVHKGTRNGNFCSPQALAE